jgi:uncharacterized protein YdaU (DUF1376 family)
MIHERIDCRQHQIHQDDGEIGVNYYERHLGDYAKDTVHLSQAEHGAYNLLMDRYYATEAGIPEKTAYRIGKANTKAERDAVDFVLSEFFVLEDGVWNKGRIQEEIIKAQAKINAAKSNGKRGGRPKKETLGSENETQDKPSGLLLGSENETQDKAHQTPDTSIKTSTSQSINAREDGKFQMHIGWEPSTHFPTLAKQAGLVIAETTLPEFIAHWLTQPTRRSQAEWDKALLQSAQHAKLRAASPSPPRSKQPAAENFAEKNYGTGVTPL